MKKVKKNHSPTAELLVLSFEAEVPGQPTPPDKEIKFDPVKVVPVLAGFPEFKRSWKKEEKVWVSIRPSKCIHNKDNIGIRKESIAVFIRGCQIDWTQDF